jgi:ribosomal subunit interface protein
MVVPSSSPYDHMVPMKVRILGSKVFVTQELRAHVERRLGLALGKFGSRIGSVTVRFSMRSTEHHCQIVIGMRPVEIRVEDQDVNLLRAVDCASDLVGPSVTRTIELELTSGGGPLSARPKP